MINLNKYQYSIEILKKHIYEVNLWDILKTQKINEEFAVKYILNPRYQISPSEENIDIGDILFFQPHLIRKKLFFYLKNINYQDDDSIDNFDVYANE